MSAKDWKKNLSVNPNRRRQVFSRKTGKWLDESEEKELMRLLEINQKKITEALEKEPDVETKKEE